jgi:pyruvate ferredoxin oxidoreductase alpha subunit
VLGGTPHFRYETHLAAQNALAVFDEIAGVFAEALGREYAMLETYRSDDAEIVFLMIGSFATKARQAVDRLREAAGRSGSSGPRPAPARRRPARRGQRRCGDRPEPVVMGGIFT